MFKLAEKIALTTSECIRDLLMKKKIIVHTIKIKKFESEEDHLSVNFVLSIFDGFDKIKLKNFLEEITIDIDEGSKNISLSEPIKILYFDFDRNRECNPLDFISIFCNFKIEEKFDTKRIEDYIATTIDNSFRSELSKLQITPEFLKTTVHKDQNESEKYVFNLDFCLPDNFDFSILSIFSSSFEYRTDFTSYFESCSRSIGTKELMLSNFKIFNLYHTDNNKYKIVLTGIAYLIDKDN